VGHEVAIRIAEANQPRRLYSGVFRFEAREPRFPLLGISLLP
jgi:hypothetical protein